MLKSAENDSDEEQSAENKMASLSLAHQPTSEISKLQGKQRMMIDRASSRSSLNVNSGGVSRPPHSAANAVHPDLGGLDWGEQR